MIEIVKEITFLKNCTRVTGSMKIIRTANVGGLFEYTTYQNIKPSELLHGGRDQSLVEGSVRDLADQL